MSKTTNTPTAGEREAEQLIAANGGDVRIGTLGPTGHSVNFCDHSPDWASQAVKSLREITAAAIDRVAAEAINSEQHNPWKRIIIEVGVVNWTFEKEHETDPIKALNALLCQAEKIALDPTVSEDARKLQNEAWRKGMEDAAKIADKHTKEPECPERARYIAEDIRAAATHSSSFNL